MNRSWGLGGLDLGERKSGFASTGHAIIAREVLTKYPKAGWPQWVLDSSHRIRFVMASRAVGRIVSAEAERRWAECATPGESADRAANQGTAEDSGQPGQACLSMRLLVGGAERICSGGHVDRRALSVSSVPGRGLRVA